MSSASAAAVDVAWKERKTCCCCCCCPRPSGIDDDDVAAACRSFNSSLLLVVPRTIVVDFIIFGVIYLYLLYLCGMKQQQEDRPCFVRLGIDCLSI